MYGKQLYCEWVLEVILLLYRVQSENYKTATYTESATIQSVWNVVHENMRSTTSDRSKKRKLAKEKTKNKTKQKVVTE